MNKFIGVLLLGAVLLAGCVDREGYYNSVREEESHGLTSLRGQPELRYSDDLVKMAESVRRYSLIPAVCFRVL